MIHQSQVYRIQLSKTVRLYTNEVVDIVVSVNEK